MSSERARIVCLIAVAVWLVCFIAGTFFAHAVEYKPDTREALSIRPEKPLQRLQRPQTCTDRPQPIQRVDWRIEDASGNVIEAGTIFIRRRC